MKIKKIVLAALAAAFAATSVFSSAIAVSAEEPLSNVAIHLGDAKEARVEENGNRQQSVSLSYEQFDASRLTKDSEIIITYEITAADKSVKSGSNHVELVVQSWENPDTPKKDSTGGVWEIVDAKSDDGKTAVFTYDDIVEAYGTDDFTLISKLNVEAASASTIKCTGFSATNCLVKGSRVIAESDDSSKGESNILWIIVGIISGVVLCIAVVFIILNKKSNKAFDVTTGEYVSKKTVKK